MRRNLSLGLVLAYLLLFESAAHAAWYREAAPGFDPTIPSAASGGGDVYYVYEFVGDTTAQNTCSSSFFEVLGYTMHWGTRGSNKIVDREEAQENHRSNNQGGLCWPQFWVEYDHYEYQENQVFSDPTDFAAIVNKLHRYAEDDASSYPNHYTNSGPCWVMKVWKAPYQSDYHTSYTGPCSPCGTGSFEMGWSAYYKIEVTITSGCPSSPTPPSLVDPVEFDNEVFKPTVTVTKIADANETYDTKGKFRISRTGPTAGSLSVSYSISGTAIPYPSGGADFHLSGSSTISVGNTYAEIEVDPTQDGVAEGTETVILTITSSSNYDIGSPSSATVNITD